MSAIGAVAVAHAVELGRLLQDHPTTTLSIAGAGGIILYAWGVWTFSLHKANSKRERIRDAISKGRLVCHCTESGEIMTQHHAPSFAIDVYACPTCTNVEIVSPRGEVLIDEETEFKPPLPATARNQWLQQSNAQRRAD